WLSVNSQWLSSIDSQPGFLPETMNRYAELPRYLWLARLDHRAVRPRTQQSLIVQPFLEATPTAREPPWIVTPWTGTSDGPALTTRSRTIRCREPSIFSGVTGPATTSGSLRGSVSPR